MLKINISRTTALLSLIVFLLLGVLTSQVFILRSLAQTEVKPFPTPAVVEPVVVTVTPEATPTASPTAKPKKVSTPTPTATVEESAL